MSDPIPVYNVTEGLSGRDGGPYLDRVQSLEHEVVSAAREGREPNYENPLPGPGVQAVTAGALFAAHPPLSTGPTEITVDPIGYVPVIEPEISEESDEEISEDEDEDTSPVTSSEEFSSGI